MKFIIKAVIQQVLSHLPRSESLNYFFQRNVIKSFESGDEAFLAKVAEANMHFITFIRNYPKLKINDAQIYEFGAGWNLINPLAYYCFGVQHQTLIDIRPNLRLELVNETLSKLHKYKPQLEQIYHRQLRLPPLKEITATDIADIFGINYLAPVDADETQFPPQTFDFISNSATLEHVPENDILKVLKECYRILKPYGIMSCIIDLKDHYSYFDDSISCYNFLKYPDSIWKLLNPPLHFQNRLRYPDYINLFNQSGFDIVDQNLIRPNSSDLEIIKNIQLAEKFKSKYHMEELGVKSFWITLRKRPG